MKNLKSRKLGASRGFATIVFVAAMFATLTPAQVRRQLEVDIGADPQVRILASGVSYGEVLRALQAKLGWKIEIPPMADELKLAFVDVEAKQPEVALAKLFEGSGLGYAFMYEGRRSGTLKVLVIPMAPRETKAIQNADSISPGSNDAAGASSQTARQAPAPNPTQPAAGPPDAAAPRPEPASTVSLADAVNLIAAPPGVALSDVGRAMTLSMADAVKLIGAPPGTSPDDVGKTITLPLPTGPGKHP